MANRRGEATSLPLPAPQALPAPPCSPALPPEGGVSKTPRPRHPMPPRPQLREGARDNTRCRPARPPERQPRPPAPARPPRRHLTPSKCPSQIPLTRSLRPRCPCTFSDARALTRAPSQLSSPLTTTVQWAQQDRGGGQGRGLHPMAQHPSSKAAETGADSPPALYCTPHRSRPRFAPEPTASRSQRAEGVIFPFVPFLFGGGFEGGSSG